MGVNVAVGGFAQRKVHVLAIENLKKLGYPTPVAIHSGAIIGTDGKKADEQICRKYYQR